MRSNRHEACFLGTEANFLSHEQAEKAAAASFCFGWLAPGWQPQTARRRHGKGLPPPPSSSPPSPKNVFEKARRARRGMAKTPAEE